MKDAEPGIYWARTGMSMDWHIIEMSRWRGTPFGFTPGTEPEVELCDIKELEGPLEEPPK